MPSDRADRDQVEYFLVDGVAPPVIGGGPPESPFDLEPEPEPEPRVQRHQPNTSYERPEPPTSPIPVVRQFPPQEQEKRKSWVSRVLRLPDR